MSNTILNIRFGSRHLQIVRFGDWLGEIRMGRSPITFRSNPYHDRARHEVPGWRWFEIN
ncbi:hypothetical protein [Novosphingobium sp.]|uniref:hypothetical protein n=1 Tax=Novosphingobium sp. TaxID=1874826 RepID=UPI00286DAF37|nr:hypothetical protein [Novosphingobium sp.]